MFRDPGPCCNKRGAASLCNIVHIYTHMILWIHVYKVCMYICVYIYILNVYIYTCKRIDGRTMFLASIDRCMMYMRDASKYLMLAVKQVLFLWHEWPSDVSDEWL